MNFSQSSCDANASLELRLCPIQFGRNSDIVTEVSLATTTNDASALNLLLAPYSLRRRPCVPITAEIAPRSSATVTIIFVVLVVFFGAAPIASGQLTTPVDGFIFQHHHAHVSGRPKETTPDRISMMDVAVAQAAWFVLHDAGHAVFDIFNTPIFGHTKDAAQAEEKTATTPQGAAHVVFDRHSGRSLSCVCDTHGIDATRRRRSSVAEFGRGRLDESGKAPTTDRVSAMKAHKKRKTTILFGE
jgi:hypothetical protein